ncbi:MAG TPA: hypothetical protein VM942_08915 [Acidimicrobiales bacterium]|nr:hypothetical protein [Acidimicrobiales bacterium]
MRPRWWKPVPATHARLGWLDAEGFSYLGNLELLDVDEVRRQEGDPKFQGHDEDALLKLGERDRCLDRDQELLRSRRMRARRRGLEEKAGVARAAVELRRRDVDEAGALLGQARRELAAIAVRQLSDRTYRRRKAIFATGEAVSLAVAFSAAFDAPPVLALLLSGAIAVAFVVAGDLGGILRLSADRGRLAWALERDAVQLDPRYRHIVMHQPRRWLTVVGCVAAGLFGIAAASVGVLRAADTGSVGLAAGLALLTVTLAVASGLSSWQHASVGCEVIDHLQREEEAAARRWRRAARARVLRRYDALGENLDVRWRASEERGMGRMRLAEAHCAYFRARHPRVFGHGVRRSEGPGRAEAAASISNGATAKANGSTPMGNGWVGNGHERSNGHGHP